MIIIIHLNTQLHNLKAAYAVKIPQNECKRNVVFLSFICRKTFAQYDCSNQRVLTCFL